MSLRLAVFHRSSKLDQVRMRSRSHREECLFRHLCSHCHISSSTSTRVMRFTYSRAQRYGSNARILGRAHFCRLNGEFREAMLRGRIEGWVKVYDNRVLVGNFLAGSASAATSGVITKTTKSNPVVTRRDALGKISHNSRDSDEYVEFVIDFGMS